MRITLLVLAAGMGSRYGELKQLDSVGNNGETLMDYAVFDARKAGFSEVVFVIRKSFEKDFIQNIASKYAPYIRVKYVYQEIDLRENPKRTKPWGTAHAVLMAKEIIHNPFAVINADDFYGTNAFQEMYRFLHSKEESYALVAYKLHNTLSKHGSVSRGICRVNKDFFLENIVEHTHIIQKNNHILSQVDNNDVLLEQDGFTSLNFFGLQTDIFPILEKEFARFYKKHKADNQAEFYLPKLINDSIHTYQKRIKVLVTNDRWLGITYAKDKRYVEKILKKMHQNGDYPQNLFE